MRTDYEPGTVGAYTLTSGATNFVVRTGESCNLKCPYSGEHWHGHIGAVSGETVEIRRVLVIDPEDDEQTSALFHHADNTLGEFRERLRMMAVPVPPEPAGDRAVVADKEGDAWQKRRSDWANTYGGHASWRELNERYGPVAVLREGYAPEAES